jgi:hypothetical protein
MGASQTRGFSWYWLIEPPVLVAVFVPAAIVILRFRPHPPFTWLWLYAGAIVIGARTGCWLRERIRPNSNPVVAPPLFTLFWLLIILSEMLWLLFR